jgi:hypothetical protein
MTRLTQMSDGSGGGSLAMKINVTPVACRIGFEDVPDEG